MTAVSPWWSSDTRAYEADSSQGADGPVPPSRPATRAANEFPKLSMLEKSYGPSGSVPPNTPASMLSPDRWRYSALTVNLSSTWERWWFVGNFIAGRAIGSSVPYGAKPRPADSEKAPPGASQALNVSIASCTRVCGCRLSMNPSPQPPYVSSPSGWVHASKFSVVRSTNRAPGVARLTMTAGCVR